MGIMRLRGDLQLVFAGDAPWGGPGGPPSATPWQGTPQAPLGLGGSLLPSNKRQEQKGPPRTHTQAKI